jgi:predicted nucleic acid-binding protein
LDAQQWGARIERGLLRVSTVTLLELGYSAQNFAGWQQAIYGLPLNRMVLEYLSPRAESRAVEVQGMLARRGQHRAPSIPDLLLAATAELAGLTVLHCDKDFDLIAQVTGQPAELLSLPTPS